MNINFEDEEMKSFLLKHGYTIKETDTYYKNGEDELEEVRVPIVYKGDFPVFISKNIHSVELYFGVKVVFEQVLKEKLLEL